MEWRGTGILLAVRRHGENSAIIDVFTEEKGRHAGVVRGGAGRKMGPILQPGAQLDVAWRARLEDHLGSYTVEPLRSRACFVFVCLNGNHTVRYINAPCSCWTYLNTPMFGPLPICDGNWRCWKRWDTRCN
jgi:hypothetical protein